MNVSAFYFWRHQECLGVLSWSRPDDANPRRSENCRHQDTYTTSAVIWNSARLPSWRMFWHLLPLWFPRQCFQKFSDVSAFGYWVTLLTFETFMPHDDQASCHLPHSFSALSIFLAFFAHVCVCVETCYMCVCVCVCVGGCFPIKVARIRLYRKNGTMVKPPMDTRLRIRLPGTVSCFSNVLLGSNMFLSTSPR